MPSRSLQWLDAPFHCNLIYEFFHADYAWLINHLDGVAHEWNELGIQLNVKNLKKISSGFNSQKCLREVVLHWLNNCTKPATREVLEKALEAIQNRRLARNLSSEFNLPEGWLLAGL